MKLLKTTIIAAVVALLAGLASCSSGLSALNRGDYFGACTQAINRLKSDPGNVKAVEALSTGYPYARSTALRQINSILDRKDIPRVDEAIRLYRKLNSLYDEIHATPAALKVIPNPTRYDSELGMALDIAAENYYSRALKALGSGTVEGAREALTLFRRVQNYRYSFRDTDKLIAEATYKATLRVVVMRPTMPDGLQISADFFYTKLMNDITRRKYRNPVRFYTPEEARSAGMNDPHHSIALDFQTFAIGQPRESSRTTDARRDSVVIGQVRIDGRNHDVFGTVKAKYTVFRVQLVSAGALGVRVMEAPSNRVLQRRNFEGSSSWNAEWATFNGDERALTDHQYDLTRRKPAPPPPPQELFASFADPLYAQASAFIASLY